MHGNLGAYGGLAKILGGYSPQAPLADTIPDESHNFDLKFKEYIPMVFCVLLHHKTKQEFIFCIDNTKVYLKAVSYL